MAGPRSCFGMQAPAFSVSRPATVQVGRFLSRVFIGNSLSVAVGYWSLRGRCSPCGCGRKLWALACLKGSVATQPGRTDAAGVAPELRADEEPSKLSKLLLIDVEILEDFIAPDPPRVLRSLGSRRCAFGCLSDTLQARRCGSWKSSAHVVVEVLQP